MKVQYHVAGVPYIGALKRCIRNGVLREALLMRGIWTEYEEESQSIRILFVMSGGCKMIISALGMALKNPRDGDLDLIEKEYRIYPYRKRSDEEISLLMGLMKSTQDGGGLVDGDF